MLWRPSRNLARDVMPHLIGWPVRTQQQQQPWWRSCCSFCPACWRARSAWRSCTRWARAPALAQPGLVAAACAHASPTAPSSQAQQLDGRKARLVAEIGELRREAQRHSTPSTFAKCAKAQRAAAAKEKELGALAGAGGGAAPPWQWHGRPWQDQVLLASRVLQVRARCQRSCATARSSSCRATPPHGEHVARARARACMSSPHACTIHAHARAHAQIVLLLGAGVAWWKWPVAHVAPRAVWPLGFSLAIPHTKLFSGSGFVSAAAWVLLCGRAATAVVQAVGDAWVGLGEGPVPPQKASSGVLPGEQTEAA